MNFNFKMGVYMNLRIGTKNKAVYLKIGSHKKDFLSHMAALRPCDSVGLNFFDTFREDFFIVRICWRSWKLTVHPYWYSNSSESLWDGFLLLAIPMIILTHIIEEFFIRRIGHFRTTPTNKIFKCNCWCF